jgi:hypothetical protein
MAGQKAGKLTAPGRLVRAVGLVPTVIHALDEDLFASPLQILAVAARAGKTASEARRNRLAGLMPQRDCPFESPPPPHTILYTEGFFTVAMYAKSISFVSFARAGAARSDNTQHY